MNIYPLSLLLIGGGVLTIGDIVIKKWVEEQSQPAFWLGMVIYLIGLVFLAHTFKYKNMAVASVIFVIFNVVTLSFTSYAVFNEKLSLPQLAGVFLGIVSIAILELCDS